MEQLGLTVNTILLDPGHGGKDPGCVANKLVEKDFSLRMAKRIGALLEKKGFTVLYTRTGDRFVSLPARPEMANAKNADLLISLHLNANSAASVRGLETYYLSEARTGDAAKVAARENGVSLQNISDLQVILTDLMLNAKQEESHALALCVQKAILGSLQNARLAAVDGGVRSAPFYVLMGARMPAILVEFGYASNSRDAANLQSEKFLQRQAEGVVDGILAYKEQLAKTVR
jgi:N-acetylmuramoyl-L-alanine amidase